MKIENKRLPNARPRNDTPPKNPTKSDPNASAKTGRVKRSQTVDLPSVKLALMPFCGENLLCIILGNDVWILESEIIRSVGLKGSNKWKKDVPDSCRAKIVVPRFEADNAELSLISVTGLYYFIKTSHEFIEDDPHYYSKVIPEKK